MIKLGTSYIGAGTKYEEFDFNCFELLRFGFALVISIEEIFVYDYFDKHIFCSKYKVYLVFNYSFIYFIYQPTLDSCGVLRLTSILNSVPDIVSAGM